ncbi:hypothetical protein, unknown function [Leishmania braziliensis MHOM/BR/75/M2904]|uniref:Uncharacterized protein n=2 Tax=Leishmania braziliensis TaxID=5660 RepID=A4H6T5_LEIBR|nr:hypothetical protein, unknown function [Leishmania braziliensis MHOM/BR/75/M2904]KAI5688899.1 hypothetical protein MNV84_01570 [Leishmania braziliensis]CAJ2468364.1 unnamed protein product [Leishmania braziliensis]CAM37395.2 hypothetical protein, unknown function [Leishmania braziliensis MHOM/BR/75/M2904]SYZ63717.1 hypothetical_protein [Leishmania braziliensis MHOM/BR/75/M2904]
MPLAQSSFPAPPDSDGGSKEGKPEKASMTPERRTQERMCSSLTSASVLTGTPGASVTTSGRGNKDCEAERIDAEHHAVSDTQDHEPLLHQLSSSTDITDSTSSLLRPQLFTLLHGAGTARTAAGDGASSSVVNPILAPISSSTPTTAVSKVSAEPLGTPSPCQQIEPQLSCDTSAAAALNSSSATTPLTTAGVSACVLFFSSPRGRNLSNASHRLYQTFFLWADAAASLAASSSTSSPQTTPTEKSRVLPPLSSSSTRAGHEDASDAGAAAAVGHVEAEGRSESTGVTAPLLTWVHPAIEKRRPAGTDLPDDGTAAATAATPSVTRQRQAAGVGCSDVVPPRSVASSLTSCSVTAVTQSGPQAKESKSHTFTKATATQAPLLPECEGVGSSSAPVIGCSSTESGLPPEVSSQHTDESESSSSDLRFSSTASPSMHLARYTTDAEQRSRPSERSGHAGNPHDHGDCSRDIKPGGSRDDGTKERRPNHDHNSDRHGAARSRDGDVAYITMSSLITQVAVPPTVHEVLRNANATKEELWMALRTACQQCELLQRRLARAEGALGKGEEGEATEDEEGAADEEGALTNTTAHRRRCRHVDKPSKKPLRTHTVEEKKKATNRGNTVKVVSAAQSRTSSTRADSAQMPSSTAPPTPTQTSRQSSSGHQARKRFAKPVPAAASTPPTSASVLFSGRTSTTAVNLHGRGYCSNSDASSALRNRVSEAIRRFEAKRKAPPHSPRVRQSPEMHTRPEICGLGRPMNSRDVTNGSQLSRASTACKTVRDPQHSPHMESGSSRSSSDTGAASWCVSRSGSANSLGEAPVSSGSGILMMPEQQVIAGLEAQDHVAQRGCKSTERVQPSPKRQKSRHRHREAPLLSVNLVSATQDESVCSNGPAAATESLTALSGAAGSIPATWPSYGMQAFCKGSRGAESRNGGPRAACSPMQLSTARRQSGWAQPTSANGASAAVIASLVTPLSGALPALHPSIVSRRSPTLRPTLQSGESISSESARLRQHPSPKATPYRAAAARVSYHTTHKQQRTSPQSRSPKTAALPAASATLEMLKQLQQEDAPVPPVTSDDQKAALRQWRREAAVMKVKGSAPTC